MFVPGAMPMAMPMGAPMPGPGGPGPGFGGGAAAYGSMPAPFPAAADPAAPLQHGGGGGGGGGGGAGRFKAVQATRKKTAAGQEHRHEMRERMRYIMHEIDETNGRFISSRTEHEPFQFLDVCCCPGGFSTYSLTAGPAPRKGIGLSLPPDLGGHLPAIALETDQYLLHFVDVTTVAAGVRVGDMDLAKAGCPRPALRLDAALDEPPSSLCQLVILDGSFLGGKDWIHKETSMLDADNPAFNVYSNNAAAHQALLVAQLIVMANNLAEGGLLVLRLNMFPNVFTIGVLGLLRLVFRGTVCSYKPRSCHVHVGSYYLVCTGFDPKLAYRMQWVPRWQSCLQSLRARAPASRFVPFPGLHLDTNQGTSQVWTRAMYFYHVHLWRFLKLVDAAMEEKAMLDRRQPSRPRAGRFTHMCGRIFGGTGCSGRCNAAHSFDELHPFVQKAFAEPRGFLHHPSSPALVQALTVSSDPLPETLLALRQQAHMQAVHQAQAVAASQQAALAAVAAGGANANWGHLGSYDSAVELGMAGEWVHGLMRHHQAGGGGGAGEAAMGEEAAFRFFVADGDTVMEGGFDEDEPEHPVRHPGLASLAAEGAAAGGVAAAAAEGAVADEFSSAGAGAGAGGGADDEEDRECAASAEAAAAVAARLPSGGGGGGGMPAIQPQLLRMSGYQPHWGLVAVEVQDDETLEAMLDYLGR